MLLAGLAPPVFFAIAAAVCLGSVVQRLSGQAFGMIASPVVALIAPQHLPATVLLLGLFVGAGALSMDLKAVSWREAKPGMAGRLVGGVIGAAIAARLADGGAIGVVVAVIVLIAVALSLSGLRPKIRPLSLGIAGATAGVMGTITAIGAPPMAILYAHEEATRSRAMQNLFFGWGMICSITALVGFGVVSVSDLVLAVCLVPFAALGLFASRSASHLLAGRPIRPVALTLATAAALTILARALLA